MGVGVLGQADCARLANALKARGDIDAIRVLTQQKAEFRRRETDAIRTHFAELRDQIRPAAKQTPPLDQLRDIKRLNDHLLAGAAYPVLEASGDLMPSRIIDDGDGDGRSGWRAHEAHSIGNRFARGCGDPLCEHRHELFEFRALDQRNRLAWLDPLNQPLFELRPVFALSFDQQREDLDPQLTWMSSSSTNLS